MCVCHVACNVICVLTQKFVLKFMSCHSVLYVHGPDLFVLFLTGMSALHMAVQKGNCDIIKMLLDAGADANQRVSRRF